MKRRQKLIALLLVMSMGFAVFQMRRLRRNQLTQRHGQKLLQKLQTQKVRQKASSRQSPEREQKDRKPGKETVHSPEKLRETRKKSRRRSSRQRKRTQLTLQNNPNRKKRLSRKMPI